MHEHDESCLTQAMSESANCADPHGHGDTAPRASRRGLLRAAGLFGVGAALVPAAPASAQKAHGPDKEDHSLDVDFAERVGRNPSTPAIGVASAGKPWLLGAYRYADIVGQAFYGWLGDVRIVGRALRPDQFLNA